MNQNIREYITGAALVGVALAGLFAAGGPADASLPTCGPAALKGTYSFLTTGFGPVPPQDLLPTPVGAGGVILPLHAIGHVRFTATGANVGYIHENVGGAIEELVPFEGVAKDFHAGPHGEGCTATWILKDEHHLPIFQGEPSHHFRIALGKGRFEFMTFGGGPGPAVLSGFATKVD